MSSVSYLPSVIDTLIAFHIHVFDSGCEVISAQGTMETNYDRKEMLHFYKHDCIPTAVFYTG